MQVDTTKSQRCRACSGEDLRFLRRLPSMVGDGSRDFYTCLNCGTIVDVSETILDYAEGHIDKGFEAAVRYCVEYGAGLGFTAWLMQVLQSTLPQRNGTPARFLDVGAGMGFCTDIARWFGWEAVGVEPSRRGQVGGQLLGVSILPEYLEKTDLANESFEAVFSSEVVEHVPNPQAFVNTLSRYLAPEGVLLLITPNAGVVHEPGEIEAEVLQAFAPGHHLTLFSEAGLRLLLARGGMQDVRIYHEGGVSGKKRLIVLAAKREGILPANLGRLYADAVQSPCMSDYLEHLVRDREARGQRDSVYWGSAYRLVEEYVNRGDYLAASPLIDTIDAYLAMRNLSDEELLQWHTDSLIEYSARVPCFLGHYKYYRGMFAINHQNDLVAATQLFRVAAHLCEIEEGLPGCLYLGATSKLARLHEGIALARQGKREGLAIFKAMLAQSDALPDEIAARVKSELAAAERPLADGLEAAAQVTEAIPQTLEVTLRDLDHVSPETRDTVKAVAAAAANSLEAIPRELANFNVQMERLASGVAGGTEQTLAGIRECLDRLDRLGARGKSVLGHVERLLTVIAETFQVIQTLFRGVLRIAAAVRWFCGLPVSLVRRASQTLRSHGPSVRVTDLQRPAPQASEKRHPLGEIRPDTFIEQTVVCPANHFSHMALMVGTYQRVNTAHLALGIYNDQGELVRDVARPTDTLADNEFAVFHFEPISESRDKTFRLRISSPDAQPGNAVTLWARAARRPAGLSYCGKMVTDAELITRLGWNGKRTVLAGSQAPRRDLLILTPDHLGHMRIGLAMRHWEIAEALSRAGLRVTLASTRPVPSDLASPAFRVEDVSLPGDKMVNLAREHAAVMIQGTILTDFPALREIERPLIADMVTPMHIESIETSQEQYLSSLKAIEHCLETADFFVCGNERQRLYWLGMLTALGRLSKEDRDRDREFRHLIDVVHFGISDDEPQKTRPVLKGVLPGLQPDDFLLTWFGGIWNWLDPLPLVRAVHGAHEQDPRIKLFFSMYRKNHEQPHAMAVRAKELSKELGALDRSIFFKELPVPFDQRADYLLESDLGVIVQASNFETQLSARTRALDYLWANLPIFINRGDEIGELVARHGIGIVADSNDPAELQRVLLDYVRDPARRERAVAAVREVKKNFLWSSTVRPILRFCQGVAK